MFWEIFLFFPEIFNLIYTILDMYLKNDPDLEIFDRKDPIFFPPKVFSGPYRHIERKKKQKNTFQKSGRDPMNRPRSRINTKTKCSNLCFSCILFYISLVFALIRCFTAYFDAFVRIIDVYLQEFLIILLYITNYK